jgi:hypothetical protein
MSTYFQRKGILSEDALTGMLADLLTWWPVPGLVDRVLACARPFNGTVVADQPRLKLDAWSAI